MAKVVPNPAAGQFSGRVSDLVFVRRSDGKVIVRNRGKRRAPKRPGELAGQKEFAEAVRYAEDVWAKNSELKARYQAAGKLQHRQGFNLAKADYLRWPEIQEIVLTGYTGNPGESIVVKAVDDFDLQSVQIRILDLNDAALEQGNAVMDKGNWAYGVQTQVPAGQTVVVEAIATDFPGHSTSKRADHACGARKSPAA